MMRPPGLSASVTPSREAVSSVPTSGVVSLMLTVPEAEASCPNSRSRVPSLNCRRSIPVRRSVPSRPATRSTTVTEPSRFTVHSYSDDSPRKAAVSRAASPCRISRTITSCPGR
ncbi:hypothetical protein D3C84_652920 [compost metagenome]